MKLPKEKQTKGLHEFYGPIDGVRPKDHQDHKINPLYGYTYLAICYSTCLKAITPGEVYISNNYYKNRMCAPCYQIVQPQNYIQQDHTIAHRGAYDRSRKLYCIRCIKQIMNECGSGGDCPLCIEEVMENTLHVFMRQKELFVKQRF